MGMFDTVKGAIDHPSYKYGHGDLEFQTKDLELNLNTYTFKDNRLYLVEVLQTGKVDPPKEVDFTGEMELYTDEDPNGWVTYMVDLECGLVTDVRLISLTDKMARKPKPKRRLIIASPALAANNLEISAIDPDYVDFTKDNAKLENIAQVVLLVNNSDEMMKLIEHIDNVYGYREVEILGTRTVTDITKDDVVFVHSP